MRIQPGNVFIHRNIANLVNKVYLNMMSVLNYAVKYLKVNHVVVYDHYNCSDVNAVMHPILNPS